MSQRLRDKVDLLLAEIQRNPALNVKNSARYKELIDALVDEYAKYTAYLETELQRITAQADTQAKLDSAALIAATLASYGLSVRPKQIPTAPAASRILAPGTELYDRLHKLGGLQSQRIIDKLLEGIRGGWGYEKLGGQLVNDLGMGLTDALRWARTVQMEAYRETAHNTMLENSSFVDGWTWWAQVDERTCEDCAGSHGTFHDASESLNDITTHIWNCRCVELPHVRGDDNPVTGEPVESE